MRSACIAMCALAVLANGATATEIGIYHWGGAYPRSVAEGVEAIADLGGTVARVTISARAAVDYHTGSGCVDDFSLLAGVQTADMVRSFANEKISTFILTAYDGLTFHCLDQSYLNPEFYSPWNRAALEQEYSDMTLYLLRTYPTKRFILANWEGDNAIYCGAAYSYATDRVMRAACDANYAKWNGGIPSPAHALRGFRLWLEERIAGVADGRRRAAAEGIREDGIRIAAEMNIVRALRDRGFASVLYNVLPGLAVDYVSYSSYESINGANPAFTLHNDLETIRQVTGLPVIIGEFGFSWRRADALMLSGAVLAAAEASRVEYAVTWNLFDQSEAEQYGLFDCEGNPTPLAVYFFQWFHPGRRILTLPR